MYTTKELTKKTWPDFEKLFSRGNGWGFCWCMHFQRPRTLPASQRGRTRAELAIRNRRKKKELVEQGQAHGILVYANGEAVGWCQYGQRGELPRIDNSHSYRALRLENGPQTLWRITCFVTAKKHRRRGVASAALEAVLESIRKKGGGMVEAYPMIPWQELCRARIQRCGHAPAFGNSSTHGTLAMFEKRGFRQIGTFGWNHVVVRKKVIGAEKRSGGGRVP